MTHTRGVHVALSIVIAMWGLVFVAIARLLPYLDAAQLVAIRFALIALIFAAIFVVVPSTRPKLTSWRDVRLFLVLGVLAVPGSQLTIVNGQNYLAPPLVSLVVTTSPAWAAVIAAIWLAEPINRKQAVGFAIALIGVAIVILAGVGDTELTVSDPLGASLTLISPVSWAMFTILSKVHIVRFPPVTAVGTAMIAGSITMIPLYPHALEGIGDITTGGWAWMGYLAIGGTVIPYLVWWQALGKLTAATTTAYMYAIPIAALIWSWVVLGIAPTVVALVGGVVIIGGVSMIQFARRASSLESIPSGRVPT